MIGNHPNGMVGIFGNGADIGTKKTALHIQQAYRLAFLVVNKHTRGRTMPDKSA